MDVVICESCAAQLTSAPDGYARALFTYDEVGAKVIAALKFSGVRAVADRVAGPLASLVESPVDVITWAPTSAVRRRHRGGDQAEWLARRVAVVLGTPCRSLLIRTSHRSQTGATRAERLNGPQFVAVGGSGLRIAVIDDVVTTGSTLRAASAALWAVGAHGVQAIALARTPPTTQ